MILDSNILTYIVNIVYIVLVFGFSFFSQKLQLNIVLGRISKSLNKLRRMRDKAKDEALSAIIELGKPESDPKPRLEALLQFRKKVAEKKDKPLFKIIGNRALIKITTAKPTTFRRLKGTKNLSEKQILMYGNALVEAINTAMKIPEEDLPVYPRKKVPVVTYRVKGRFRALREWRDKRARELEIDPALLFNKELLKSIAEHKPCDKNSLETIRGMRKWQNREFGREIIATLRDIL